MNETSCLWGIDLGGTKIEGVVLDRSNYSVLAKKRIPTQREKGYKHILNRINTLLAELKTLTGASPSIVGIGTPGTLDPVANTIKNSNTTCLNDTPFKNDLESVIKVPIVTANDANCFALAETKMGAVKNHSPNAKVVFGVIMGTGVGGGIVVNGNIIHGKQGIAGEWGHNFLDESGGPCYCGKHGCVETVISGPALEKYYEKQCGEYRTLRDIVTRSTEGNDKIATMTINRLAEQFGKAITVVINILDPDVIVLGGGLGNIETLYTTGVENARRHVFNKKLETLFLKPELGDSAGVYGAAMLVNDQ